jgi:hypothetical protein
MIRFKTSSTLKGLFVNSAAFCARALVDLLVALLGEVLGTEVALVGFDVLMDE